VNPSDLINHAFVLLREDASQVDLRRAVSAAYYAIFHAFCTMVADEYVGEGSRMDFEYERCYRALDHSRVKKLHDAYKQSKGADAGIESLCNMAKVMQTERHLADYHPNYEINYEKALTLLVDTMLSFTELNKNLTTDQKRRLSALLMFQERRE
jgi:uncharacterized protein (UPF0332 family)